MPVSLAIVGPDCYHGRVPGPLRTRKVVTTSQGTQWLTANGGVFIEPVQRPDLDNPTVTLHVTISRAHYKLLEVLFDDVAAYASRLLTTHAAGLVKSAAHNAKQKEQNVTSSENSSKAA